MKNIGLEKLKVIDNIDKPEIGNNEVLIKVRLAGVNPIDHTVVYNAEGVKPMPHIPGVQITGIIDKVGNYVENLNQGDRVTVYSRVFDSNCDMC